MLILGIETSDRIGSVALWREGRSLAERSLAQAGRRHAQSLVAEIQELLRAAQLEPAHCDLVAVSIGPGSFTGLRVGVVCAKTFAYATGCAVVGVDTYLSIAAAAPEEVSSVWVIGNAHRGELFVGRYRRLPGGDWSPAEPIHIVSAAEWCRARAPGDVVSGPGVELFAGELAGRCVVLPLEQGRPTAARIAQLGAMRLAQGSTDDVWGLQPFYLRPSAAEEHRPPRMQ